MKTVEADHYAAVEQIADLYRAEVVSGLGKSQDGVRVLTGIDYRFYPGFVTIEETIGKSSPVYWMGVDNDVLGLLQQYLSKQKMVVLHTGESRKPSDDRRTRFAKITAYSDGSLTAAQLVVKERPYIAPALQKELARQPKNAKSALASVVHHYFYQQLHGMMIR